MICLLRPLIQAIALPETSCRRTWCAIRSSPPRVAQIPTSEEEQQTALNRRTPLPASHEAHFHAKTLPLMDNDQTGFLIRSTQKEKSGKLRIRGFSRFIASLDSSVLVCGITVIRGEVLLLYPRTYKHRDESVFTTRWQPAPTCPGTARSLPRHSGGGRFRSRRGTKRALLRGSAWVQGGF